MFGIKETGVALFNIAYVFAPACGFLPQIYHGNIDYNPILSLLTIFSSILKLFPSQEKVSTVIIYQFCFAIILHFYLIRAQMPDSTSHSFIALFKNSNDSKFTQNSSTSANKSLQKDFLPVFRKIQRYLIIFVLSFIMFLGILDSLSYTYLFMKAALIIEILISLLHIKLIKKKDNLKILSLVLLFGDIAKTFVLLYKFRLEVPSELIIASLAQMFINLYLAIR